MAVARKIYPYIRNHRYLNMGIHIYNPVIRSKIEVWRSGGCQACANTRTPRVVHPHPPHKRQALAPTSHQSKTAAPTTTWHTVPQGVKALPKHRYRDLSFPLAVDREARRWAGVLGGGQCTTNPDTPFFVCNLGSCAAPRGALCPCARYPVMNRDRGPGRSPGC